MADRHFCSNMRKLTPKKKTLVLAASDLCKVFVYLCSACGDEFSSRVCVVDAMASCSMLAQSPLQISSLSFCPRPALVQEKENHYDSSLLQASCGIISCSCFSQSSSLLSPGRRRKQSVSQPTRSRTGLRTDLLKAVVAAASTGFAGTVPGNTNRGFSTEKV